LRHYKDILWIVNLKNALISIEYGLNETILLRIYHNDCPGIDMMSSHSTSSRKCPECNSTDILFDAESGEWFCSKCGLVLLDAEIDEGPEWRSFDVNQYMSRARASAPLDPVRVNTFGSLVRDGRGNKIQPSKMHLMLRLKRLHNQSRFSEGKERNLSHALSNLDRLSNRLHVSSLVREEAVKIYRKALDKNLIRGRSIEAIAGASLYAACRLTGTPRTLVEVSENCSVPSKDLARGYRLVYNELGLEMPNPDPRTRIPQIAERIEASLDAQRKALEILEAAQEAKETIGLHPVGLAAAALYLACRECGDRITQKDIADASGVTEVTIRNRYKKLEKFMHSSIG
jgi:transcription initiation factor TFIIB